MKAIVLAAGYGTRMYPLTLTTAKGLLDVCGKPLMDLIMNNLIEAKPSEVCIICNNKFFEDYKKWAKGWENKVKITLINDKSTSDETKLGALKDLMLAWKNINEEVIVLASDNLLGFSLKEFAKKKVKGALVAVHDLKNIEEAKKHGLVELKGTEIVGFEEKPLNPKTTLASICCYKFNNETKPLLEQYLKEGHKDNTGNFIKYLIGKQKINAFLFKEKVYDIGSMQSYEMVCKKMAK